MKINRLCLLGLIFLVQIPLYAQKLKVAVLDAIIHSGVKESLVIPITENIIEALVGSGKYTVLDRAHVTKIMEEKKFQVSGIVKSADIKLVGNYLGADIIVVIDVSLIEDIYFVSAKMIDVESGEIRNQASHKQRGDVSVIFDVAEAVGAKLTGGKAPVGEVNDPGLTNYVAGDLRSIEYKESADGKMVFYTYDMMVSGMKGKEIHVEFWISQGNDWMPNSKVSLAPEKVLYDPAYWNGNAHTFSYPLEMFKKFGDSEKPYWGTFYIIDTAADTIIFTKDVQFTLPSTNTRTTTITPPATDYFSSWSVSYLYPLFFGNVIGVFDEYVYSDVSPAFLDFHVMTVVDDIYLSFLFSVNLVSTVDAEFVAAGINTQAGGGMMYPIVKGIQGYYGARLGYYYLMLGSLFDSFDGEGQSGFSLTFETGIDLLLAKDFILNLRVQIESAMFTGGNLFPDLATDVGLSNAGTYFLNALGFSIGMGFPL